jgi:hypothetical protein
MRWPVVAIVLISAMSMGQEAGSSQYRDQLPDAPVRVTAFAGDAHNKPDVPMKYVIWNKKFAFAHVVELSSILYDVEMTHAGVAHHKCAEGGGGITEMHVSRRELYDLGLRLSVPIL